jgi:hypothetical protein
VSEFHITVRPGTGFHITVPEFFVSGEYRVICVPPNLCFLSEKTLTFVENGAVGYRVGSFARPLIYSSKLSGAII